MSSCSLEPIKVLYGGVISKVYNLYNGMHDYWVLVDAQDGYIA